jgi:replicative DNA helicase
MDAANMVHEAPLWIDESPRLDVPTLGARLRRLSTEEDLSVAYLDFLQLMRPDPTRSYDKKSDRIASTVRDLKLLARDTGVPIVLVSQLNREVERRNPPEPRLSDLREAGEEFADKVLLCYRPEHYGIRLPSGDDGHNYGEVQVAKHKDGPTGTAELAFVKQYSLWAPLDQRSTGMRSSPPDVPFSG